MDQIFGENITQQEINRCINKPWNFDNREESQIKNPIPTNQKYFIEHHHRLKVEKANGTNMYEIAQRNVDTLTQGNLSKIQESQLQLEKTKKTIRRS